MSDPAPTARREQTRQRLLAAAAEVFAEVGFDAASVEAVCDRAGFTRGAFYSNFDSKIDLFLALSADFAEHKLERVRADVRDLTPGAIGIEDLVGRVVDLVHDSRADTVLLCEIRTHALRDDKIATAHLALEAEMTARVTALVEDVVQLTGARLRLPAAEVGRIFMELWSGTATDAAIARADTASVTEQLRRRTIDLAVALTD